MNEVIRNYISDVKRIMPIDKVILFGSYAKGTATKYSDVDLCFFSPSVEERSQFEVLKDLFALGGNYPAVCIEPHAYPTSIIEEDRPFIREILRTGIEIQ